MHREQEEASTKTVPRPRRHSADGWRELSRDLWAKTSDDEKDFHRPHPKRGDEESRGHQKSRDREELTRRYAYSIEAYDERAEIDVEAFIGGSKEEFLGDDPKYR